MEENNLVDVKKWLNNDDLSIKIWLNKYRYNDETLEEWFDRVSNGNEKIKKLIKEKKFLFGGRILASRGIKDRKYTLSNCYVIEPPHDNIESIFDCNKKLARTYSYGGGCGTDLSEIRPKGAIVNNAAKTSTGVVPFMEISSQTTGSISQSGRRGALMISLDIVHPDIKDFVNSKTDLTKVNYANISTRVSNEFMEAVKKDEDFYLKWPCNTKEIDKSICKEYNVLYKCEGKDVYVKKIKARELFELLVYNNWQYAEPGILYWDNICENNLLNTTQEFSYASTNPCLSGDSLILTDEGYIRIDELCNKEVNVWNGYEYSKVIPHITGHNQPMKKVYMSDGTIVNCTDYHKFVLKDGQRVEAKNLKVGDNIVKFDFPIIEGKKTIDETNNEKLFVPDNSYTIETRIKWLSNYINLNNIIINKNGVTISTEDEQILIKIKLMFNTLGCNAYLSSNYNDYNKEVYYLLISFYNLSKLYKLGLRFNKDIVIKPELFKHFSEYITITNVEDNGNCDTVYCMNEPKNHTFIANGVIVGNCAEEPLPSGGSCLLGSINLSNFVKNPFTENAYIDYKSLKEAVHIAIEGLNEVLHEGLPLHPLQEQRECVNNWRQIGLGTFGLADMLIKMRIAYGSEESINIIHDVFKQIAIDSIEESVNLVDKYGVFPKCDKEKLASSYFMQNIKKYDEEIYNKVLKYGMANSQVLTCPPTGTIATFLGVSTGIEPLFALKYTRTTKSLEGKDTTFDVYPQIIVECKDSLNTDEIPSYIVDSSMIKPKDRIKVQSTMQEFIDASISSTINLPKDASVKDVYDIYMDAYDMKLKGVTVYRSGCAREPILSTKDTSSKIRQENGDAPKRPKKLPAVLEVVRVKGELFGVIVGLYEEKPYEVFTLRVEENASKNIKGFIMKVAKGHYKFISEDNSYNIEHLSSELSIEEKSATLWASMALRHGIEIKYIIKNAKKVNDNITSFTAAMCRVLAKFTNEGIGEMICPECGSKIVNEGGCCHCPNCGWSRCS